MPSNLEALVPLSLDRVLGGEPITSTLPVFRLPIELITRIIPHLSPLDVRNLALVDRDANQLARSLQFANVKLDYSDRALGLLAKLKDEAHSSAHIKRRISACVRRLTVSGPRDPVNARKGIDTDDLYPFLLHDRLRCIQTIKQIETEYLRDICNLLPHLPNLHALEWNDEGPLTSEMMQCMMSSPLIHLTLNGLSLRSPPVVPTSHDGVNWTLETLSLNIGGSLPAQIPGDVSTFIFGLLRLVAPTLRQLVWLGRGDSISQPFFAYEDDIHFPALRNVVFDQVNFKDSKFLHRILHERTLIQSLAVDPNSVNSRYLIQRGYISSLVSFRWGWCGTDFYDDTIRFIHDNTHLSCLEVTSPLTPAIIDTILLLQNSPRFENLVVLHLVSEGQCFSEGSLETIALIRSLQHLWLSAAVQHGTRHQWAVNHSLMANILKPLSQLRTLAFTRDTYHVDGHPLLDTSVERYYTNKVLPHNVSPDDYLTEEELIMANNGTDSFDRSMRLREFLLSSAWERWHQSQMVSFATEYSGVFKDLVWCFIGQLATRIENTPLLRIAKLDIRERDSTLKTLFAYWDYVVKAQ